MIEDDFDADAFEGVRCFLSTNPKDWKIVFPNLASYRDSWLVASEQFCAKKFAKHTHLEALAGAQPTWNRSTFRATGPLHTKSSMAMCNWLTARA